MVGSQDLIVVKKQRSYRSEIDLQSWCQGREEAYLWIQKPNFGVSWKCGNQDSKKKFLQFLKDDNSNQVYSDFNSFFIVACLILHLFIYRNFKKK